MAPAPTATTRPAPAAIPDDLQRVAVVERDGIRARIELQRNPLVAGEPNWVKTTVKNIGTDDVTWFHGGCDDPIFVNGTSAIAWSPGRDQVGQALEFKTLAMGMNWATDPLPSAFMNFVPRRMLGKGSYGCADVGITETIAPGDERHRTLWWTGYAEVLRGLPPTGPATISALAEYYWRGHRQPGRILDQKLELTLDAWVTDGLVAGRLSPLEVADAALADPAFAAFVEPQELRNGREEILWYDPEADVWEVGVMPWYDTKPPRIHGVLVDPVTGEVLGTLDRAWDKEVDPFP